MQSSFNHNNWSQSNTLLGEVGRMTRLHHITNIFVSIGSLFGNWFWIRTTDGNVFRSKIGQYTFPRHGLLALCTGYCAPLHEIHMSIPSFRIGTAPWHVLPNVSNMPCSVPVNTQLSVPMVPPTNTGCPHALYSIGIIGWWGPKARVDPLRCTNSFLGR